MPRVRRDDSDNLPVEFGELGVIQIRVNGCGEGLGVCFVPCACDRGGTSIEHKIIVAYKNFGVIPRPYGFSLLIFALFCKTVLPDVATVNEGNL